jgi:hypothetical protein
MTMRTLKQLLLLLSLALPATYAAAQVSSGVSGTIESVMMDDGIIVIDGRRLAIQAADLVITYKGQPVRASFLDAGMTVLYSTRDDGRVYSITLIGPASVLDALQNQ